MPFGSKPVKRYDPLSDRLRVIRARLGYTQEQMSFYFKVSKETYSRWERYGCPRAQASRIGIKFVLRKLQVNRAGSAKYYQKVRKVRDGKKKQARHGQDIGLGLAADGEPGE